MQRYRATFAFKPLIPLPSHFAFSPSVPSPPPYVPGCFSIPPASSPTLTPSGLFNGMLEVSKSGALSCYTLFRLLLLTLSISTNSTFTHLPLSGILDSLLWDLIALTPGLAFYLPIPCTLAVALSFSPARAYPSLNFLPHLFLRLTPNYDYVGVNISLNSSSSLSFLNVYAPPIRFSQTDSRTDSFFPSILPSFRNLFILVDVNCRHFLWDSKRTSDPVGGSIQLSHIL